MSLNAALLEILACPQCKGPVVVAADHGSLTCPACRLIYPVQDDIPVMLVEEASPLTTDHSGQPS